MSLTTLPVQDFAPSEWVAKALRDEMSDLKLVSADSITFAKLVEVCRKYDCSQWPKVFEQLRSVNPGWFAT